MKKIIFAIIIILIAGYIFKEKFGTVVPDTETIQGNFFEMAKDAQNSVNNVTEEIDQVTTKYKETKANVEDKIEKVENLVDAINDLTGSKKDPAE